MIFAVVNNNIVSDIIETDNEAVVQDLARINQAVIDITNTIPMPSIGWLLEGNTLIGAPISNNWHITKLALSNRFTDTENILIKDYENDISKPYYKYVRLLADKSNKTTYVDLKRLDTIQGIGLLVAAGIITSTRAEIILNTIPKENELYKG